MARLTPANHEKQGARARGSAWERAKVKPPRSMGLVSRMRNFKGGMVRSDGFYVFGRTGVGIF
jgi:hypothetical protein